MGEQLKDIKDVIYVLDWGVFVFLGLIVLFFLFLLYRLFKYYKRRVNKKKREKESFVPPKPADQIALEVLSVIDPTKYYDQKRVKEFYFTVTEIVRQFLSANYHIETLDKTSLEIIEEIERVERDFEKVKRLGRYFSECDLVKFAKLRPGLADMKNKKEESVRTVKEYWRGV